MWVLLIGDIRYMPNGVQGKQVSGKRLGILVRNIGYTPKMIPIKEFPKAPANFGGQFLEMY